VVARLKEVELPLVYPVNQPVLLGDPSRPAAREKALERLWPGGVNQRITDEEPVPVPWLRQVATRFAARWERRRKARFHTALETFLIAPNQVTVDAESFVEGLS